MILGGVDVPDGVLTALEEDRLIFFAGAGVSMAPPSSLPSFLQMANQIAAWTRAAEMPGDKKWKDRLDAYLGDLKHKGAEVHNLVLSSVTLPDSEPNSLHRNLVRIAATSRLRIVTTNYDLHFETAASAAGITPNVYPAPALPLGDDFDGIVHLHGSAAGPASRLVVTDTDFGRAYLRDAWAARFLERMFRTYTVVFVGYSHQDVVMKYLGLALGADSERYAFTDSTDDPGWERLGITPISYLPDHDHRALADCLENWAKLTEMGLLDHKERVRSLVSAPIELTPDERAYLIDVLRRPDRARFFFQEARDISWLNWVVEENLLERLFTIDDFHDDLVKDAARWFVQYAFDETTSQRAWEVLIGVGGRLSIALWNRAALEIFRTAGPRPAHIRRWVHLLIRSARDGCAHNYLDYILHSSVWPDDGLEFMELLRYLTEPVTSVAPGYGFIPSSWQVNARGDEYHLTEALERLRPHLDTVATDALQIAEQSLRGQHAIHAALNGTAFDPFSFRRSAIQPHDEDSHRGSIDAVIDLGRDALVHLVQSGTRGDETLRRWLLSEVTLLRRLALHALCEHRALSADEKIDTVLKVDLLWDVRCRKEVYELLAAQASTLSAPVVDQLVGSAIQQEDGTPEGARASYQLMEWLQRNGAATETMPAELARLQTAYGEFASLEHLGFTHWMESGFVGESLPATVDDLHLRVVEDPDSAWRFLMQFRNVDDFTRGQPKWSDAVSLLGATVREHPADGFLLWEHTATEPDLRGAIIKSWGTATDPEHLERIVGLLRAEDQAAIVHSVSQLFAKISDGNYSPWDHIAGIPDLIEGHWAACDEAASSGRLPDVINHPVANVLNYWFSRFRREWAASQSTWDKLRPEDDAFLTRALADPSERGAVAVALTAARAHWFHAIDLHWFRTTLLPCADWSNPERARVFWWGFLSFGRVSGGSLQAGLLDGLIDTAAQLERFEHDQQWRWAQLLASAALEVGLVDQLEWTQRLAATAPPAARVQFLDAIADRASDLPTEAKRDAWAGWAETYWSQRNAGVPCTPTVDEASALAQWVFLVPPTEIRRAVDLATSKPATLRQHGALREDRLEPLVVSHPREIGRLLTHLMNHTQPKDFHGEYWLTPLLRRLTAMAGDWRPLKDAALRLRICLD